jgi:hypothetical protein
MKTWAIAKSLAEQESYSIISSQQATKQFAAAAATEPTGC